MQDSDDEISPLDLYLAEPCGVNISSMATDLIDKYGRFWISDEGHLQYRKSNGSDISVNNISIGNCAGCKLILRVNGITIPTMALEQLRILLSCCDKAGYKVFSDLLHEIDSHRTNLNRTLF